jgi:hypothetical protein
MSSAKSSSSSETKTETTTQDNRVAGQDSATVLGNNAVLTITNSGLQENNVKDLLNFVRDLGTGAADLARGVSQDASKTVSDTILAKQDAAGSTIKGVFQELKIPLSLAAGAIILTRFMK